MTDFAWLRKIIEKRSYVDIIGRKVTIDATLVDALMAVVAAAEGLDVQWTAMQGGWGSLDPRYRPAGNLCLHEALAAMRAMRPEGM